MASKQKSSAQAANGDGYEQALTEYQRELAQYLEERLKPGLNVGAIPPLARSIARDIAAQEPPEAPLSSALSRRRYRADATHIAVPFRG